MGNIFKLLVPIIALGIVVKTLEPTLLKRRRPSKRRNEFII